MGDFQCYQADARTRNAWLEVGPVWEGKFIIPVFSLSILVFSALAIYDVNGENEIIWTVFYESGDLRKKPK